MTLEELRQEKRLEIMRLAVQHGAYNVRIFGSVARGEDTPASDIDFLVDVGSVHSPWFPAGLVRDLEQLLNRKVDVLTEAALHWYIRDKVLTEAVAL